MQNYPVDTHVAAHTEPLPDGRRPQTQLIVLNSQDRDNPLQSQNGRYYIRLKPYCDQVFAVQLKSFVGSITPYNVNESSNYRLVITIPGGVTFTYFIDFIFSPGDWPLQAILDVLNDQLYLRFSYNETTGKVIVERLGTWVGTATGSDYPATALNTIGALIGFPQGFTVLTTDNAIQTVYAVQPHQVTGSILIAFDEYPTTVLTSGGAGAGFHIPLSHGVYDSKDKKLYFTEQQVYKQTIRLNNKRADRIGIRILDAKSGSPFVFVGPHIITLNLMYMGASAQ